MFRRQTAKMAITQAAYVLKKAIGHDGSVMTEHDISNLGLRRAKYADPSVETIKALCWMGKNTVKTYPDDAWGTVGALKVT